MMTETGKRSSPMLIGFAWAIVTLPTAWGLNYTVRNALKIFAKPTATVSVPAPVPAK